MNKFKKSLLFLGALVTPALTFAEGEITPVTIDGALTEIQTGVIGIIGKIVAVVAAVILAGLALWALNLAWRKIKGGVGR